MYKIYFFSKYICRSFSSRNISTCLITSTLTDYMVQQNNGTSKVKFVCIILPTCVMVLLFRYVELGFPLLFPTMTFLLVNQIHMFVMVYLVFECTMVLARSGKLLLPSPLPSVSCISLEILLNFISSIMFFC